MLKLMTIISVLATNMLFAVSLDCQPSLTVKTTTKRKSSLSSRFFSKKHYKTTTTTKTTQLKQELIELSPEEDQIIYLSGAGLNLKVSRHFNSGDNNLALIRAMRGNEASKEYMINLDTDQSLSTSFSFSAYPSGRKGNTSQIQKTLHLECEIF